MADKRHSGMRDQQHGKARATGSVADGAAIGMRMIRRTAVLGAGTMGAQIAAHIANAGFPVLLLDVSKELADRGLRGLEKGSPAPLFVPERIRQIETGS